MTLFRPLLAITLAFAGCMSDSEHGGGAGPAAPSALTASALSGGAHLTWSDNSDDETEFMVMRMEDGVDADYVVIATVPFDSTSYHDAPLTAGASYMFQVMAMNDDGESESNAITFDAP